MKKIAIGIAAIFALTGSPVLAADMAVKVPPSAPAPVYSWTGFYLGAGYGYGMWNADTTIQDPTGVPSVGTNTAGGRGWFATGVAGYDYQFGDHLVAGLLTDFDLADIHGIFTDPTASASGKLTESSAWAAGARLGWLFAPQLLTYVSGGFTQAHFSGVTLGANASFSLPGPIATIPAHTYNGWFVGGGLETTFPFFGNGWFWRTDYRFSQYGSATVPETLVASGTLFDQQTIHPYVQTVSSALIYKFGSSGPAPAGLSFADFFKAAQMPTSTPKWTGFSLAAGGGYGTWNIETSDLFPGGTIGNYTEGGRGWFGTVNAGYDYQLTNLLVAGVFADFDLADIKGTFQDEDILVPFAGTMKEDSAWAAGVRGGWLITPQILNYYDIGFTQAEFSGATLNEDLVGFPRTLATLPSHNYSGWLLGSGLETALPFFGNGWFARVEYRYSAYDSATLTETEGGSFKDSVTMHPYVQTVRTELVYRF
jgi:outer membrane immunogenic protein